MPFTAATISLSSFLQSISFASDAGSPLSYTSPAGNCAAEPFLSPFYRPAHPHPCTSCTARSLSAFPSVLQHSLLPFTPFMLELCHSHTHTYTAELVHAFLCKCVEGNCIAFFSNIADFSYTLTLFCFSFSQILYNYSIFETKKIHLHASIFLL